MCVCVWGGGVEGSPTIVWRIGFHVCVRVCGRAGGPCAGVRVLEWFCCFVFLFFFLLLISTSSLLVSLKMFL